MLEDETLKRYFLSELSYLRRESTRFAKEYPFVASELSLAGVTAKDPQVELLVQSFAFLAGQLRCELDRRATALPDQVLEAVAPHLLRPLPSMAMAQLRIDPAGANFEHVVRLRNGAELSVESDSPTPRSLCRFQARGDLPLWPLAVDAAGSRRFADAADKSSGDSVAVKIRCLGKITLAQLPKAPIRLQLIGERRFELFDFLHRHVVGVSTKAEGFQPRCAAGRGVDFAPWAGDEPMLPRPRPVHPGLALMQEYLAFPDRYLCLELGDLDLSGYGTEMEVLLHLSEDAPEVPLEGFAINCVPIVNLFKQTLEPQPLVAGQQEYRMVGDRAHHETCEVHTLNDVVIRDSTGIRTPLSSGQSDDPDAVPYWLSRRELSQYPSVPGTELFLTVVTGPLLGARSADGVLLGEGLCTNRRLAQTLLPGRELVVWEQPAVQNATLAGAPSLHYVPELARDRTRLLTSQLTSESFPDEGGARGLMRLKDLLTRHAFAGHTAAQTQIEALTAMGAERAVHRVSVGSWHGLSAGTTISLTLDESRLFAAFPMQGASIAAFGEVLSAVLGHFAPINGSYQLTLQRADGSLFHTWPPVTGAAS